VKGYEETSSGEETGWRVRRRRKGRRECMKLVMDVLYFFAL
jgi:hypothetical protein